MYSIMGRGSGGAGRSNAVRKPIEYITGLKKREAPIDFRGPLDGHSADSTARFRKSTDFQHQRCAGVAGSTAGKQHITTAFHYRLFNPFDDQPRRGGGLRVAEDQGTAVVVEPVDVDLHLIRHVNVVGGKRIVGFDHVDIADADAGFFQCHLGGRHHCHGHVGLFSPVIPVRDHPDFSFRIGAEVAGFFAGGYDHRAVAVRRVGLGTEGDLAVG
jgi:hypothetical protein